MIGFIGGGNMAEALIKGMTSQGMREIFVSEPKEERRQALSSSYGVKTSASNREVVTACEILILAVKPQIMDAVLEDIKDLITGEKTVVSIAAGITLSYLASKLKTGKIVRVMPNTPAIVQEGMSVLSLCECFTGPEINVVKSIFMSVGRVLTLPENHMNAVTALSGSGPAFIALFVKSMTDAGRSIGLAEAETSELAVQTLLGTAKLLDTGMSPDRLMEMVTSPGGTTEAGLGIFKKHQLGDIVAEALQAARSRAEELGRKA